MNHANNRSRDVDLLLLDYRIPGMSAMQVSAEIRHTHLETAIVMMTGYATITVAVDTMRLARRISSRSPLPPIICGPSCYS